jgi:hypothetical protein
MTASSLSMSLCAQSLLPVRSTVLALSQIQRKNILNILLEDIFAPYVPYVLRAFCMPNPR